MLLVEIGQVERSGDPKRMVPPHVDREGAGGAEQARGKQEAKALAASSNFNRSRCHVCFVRSSFLTV
jgi:hypothetical protein